MKKIIFLLPFLIACPFIIAGCAKNYSLVANNISEIRRELYEGSTDGLRATYICGEREVEYLLNGISTPLVEFGVITFYSETDPASTPNFMLTIDDRIFSGGLERNPFDGSYVADIGECVSGQNVTAVYIADDTQTTIQLYKINADWEIDAERALKIACDAMGSEFNKFMNGQSFSGECYIKIVHDIALSKENYFWYVNIINGKGKSFSAVIDPRSGEVLAKKSI